MKIPLFAGILAFGLLFALPLAALDTNDNTLVNITNRLPGKDLVYLFTSPSDSEFWSADILAPGKALKSGSQASWEAYYPDQSASFDLLAIDQSGGVYKVKGITLRDGISGNVVIDNSCRISRNEADFRLMEISFENRTGRTLEYLFFSPGDSKTWGFDLLDEKTSLANHASIPVYLPLGVSDFGMEVLGIDENGKEFTTTVNINVKDESIKIVLDPSLVNN